LVHAKKKEFDSPTKKIEAEMQDRKYLRRKSTVKSSTFTESMPRIFCRYTDEFLAKKSSGFVCSQNRAAPALLRAAGALPVLRVAAIDLTHQVVEDLKVEKTLGRRCKRQNCQIDLNGSRNYTRQNKTFSQVINLTTYLFSRFVTKHLTPPFRLPRQNEKN
jgi:hypothetical protein